MKKINAILKGRKFTEKLFGLKARKIRRALEAAKDNAEKQKEDAAIAYEQCFSEMAEDDADYQRIIEKMLNNKQTILDADKTIEVIKSIEDDLESEVPDADIEE